MEGRPSPRARLAMLVVAMAASFVMVVGSAGAFGGVLWVQHKIDQRSICLSCTTGPVPSPSNGVPAIPLGAACKGTCNYLILGEQQGQGTTDTIMFVHLVSATQHATILSIPRDLLVTIPGYGQGKINSAFGDGYSSGGNAGGVRLAAATISGLTGMPINHTMLIDYTGFRALVQAVGGVPFCTPTALLDDPKAYPLWVPGDLGSGLNLPAGCSTLNGTTALELVRARSVINPANGQLLDCVSDFARIQRQQQFLRALLNKMLSPSMFPKLPQLVDAGMRYLTFDSGLKVTDLLKLASALHGLASGNADFRTLPAQLKEGTIQGVPTWYLNLTSQGQQLLDRLRSNQSLGGLGLTTVGQPPSPADIAVRVYDNSSQGHAQNDVWSAQLNSSGFKMMDTAAEQVPSSLSSMTTTTILYNPGYLEQAKVVANYVPGAYPIKEAHPGQIPSDTQVAVIVTASYVHHDPGWGKNPSVAVSCPYHATYQGSANASSRSVPAG